MPLRHFLTLSDLSTDEINALLARARDLRAGQAPAPRLNQRIAALIFECASTRTRLSFEAGVVKLGGYPSYLTNEACHLGRGESLSDTAQVLSRIAGIVVMRTGGHNRVAELAAHASVPVINALSDFMHPCQLLADLQAYQENCGPITGKRVAWVGDGNNMCHAWMQAAQRLNFELRLAVPEGYAPDKQLLASCDAAVIPVDSPKFAVKDADLVVTDCWVSLGQDDEKDARLAAFKGYQVNTALMAHAAPGAVFMHCLPAYRGLEVSAEVLDSPQSLIWEEVSCRMPAQLALMEFLLEQSAADG